MNKFKSLMTNISNLLSTIEKQVTLHHNEPYNESSRGVGGVFKLEEAMFEWKLKGLGEGQGKQGLFSQT